MVKSIQSVVVMSVSIQSELGIEVGTMVLTMVMSSGHTSTSDTVLYIVYDSIPNQFFVNHTLKNGTC